MAIDLAGTDDYLYIDDSISTINVNTVTLYACFNADVWPVTTSNRDWVWGTTAGGGATSDLREQIVVGGDGTTERFCFATGNVTTNGRWHTTSAAGGTGTWHYQVVSIDKSSDANDPTFWVNGTKYTVGSGLTREQPPVGAGNTGADGARVGVLVPATNDYNGKIATIAFWDTELPDGIMEALSNGFSPAFFPKNRRMFSDFIRGGPWIDRDTGLTWTETGDGVSVANHPRMIYPQQPQLLNFSPPADTFTAPAWMFQQQRGHQVFGMPNMGMWRTTAPVAGGAAPALRTLPLMGVGR